MRRSDHMNEEERRQEILKAEESIRQLAAEMARASGAASQADAAREKLDEARSAVTNAVKNLQELTANQKVASIEATESLSLAKKSLEDAISALTDVGLRIDKIENHIAETADEIKSMAKIIESSPAELAATLSRELSRADKIATEKHAASMQALEENSKEIQEISQSMDENHKTISETLNARFALADKTSKEQHNASLLALEDKSKIVVESINNQSSRLSSLMRWGIVFAALGLLGIWITATILLLKI